MVYSPFPVELGVDPSRSLITALSLLALAACDPITPVLMGQDIVPDAQVAITITLAVYQAAIKSDLGDLRGPAKRLKATQFRSCGARKIARSDPGD
jgi:hypothetical protein